MKSILNKVSFHYTYIILAISLALTGYYINLISFTSLIIIHELGHLITCHIMNIPVKKLTIYPYGGMITLDNKINININEELAMAISGVLFQSVFFIIISYLYNIGYLRLYTYNIIKVYHYSMLYFNLLPIYPLDGSKIINLIISKYLPFYYSNILTIILSVITLIIYMMINVDNINYSLIMMISIIIYNLHHYIKSIKYIYYKFLMERYLYNYPYHKIKVINNIKGMYKNKYHLFRVGKKKIKEKEYLSKYLQG